MTCWLSEMHDFAACDALLSSPLRGRGGEEGVASAGDCNVPPSLTLPLKGGGDDRVNGVQRVVQLQLRYA
jgi:hypothetical protein